MLNLIIVLFAAAAVAGTILAISIFKKKETPNAVVFIHGGLAASALVLLIIYAMNTPGTVLTSLVLFGVAAIGGFYLFYRDMNKKPGPVTLVAVHALAAVAGFLLLLMAAFA